MALQFKVEHVGHNVLPFAPKSGGLQVSREHPFISVDHWMMRSDPHAIQTYDFSVNVLWQLWVAPPNAGDALEATQGPNFITNVAIS